MNNMYKADGWCGCKERKMGVISRHVLAGGLTLLAIMFLVQASGASDAKELTRVTAAKLIAAQQRLPRPQTISIASKYLKKSWSQPQEEGFMPHVTICVNETEKYADAEERLIYYQSIGLLRIGFETDNGSCPALYATVTLTTEGGKYAVGESKGTHWVKVFDIALGDVTGIQTIPQFNVATAHYTLKPVNPTPFASILSLAPKQRSAEFSLFDDGWRLKKESYLETLSISSQDIPSTSALAEARREVAAAEAAEERAQQKSNLTQADLAGSPPPAAKPAGRLFAKVKQIIGEVTAIDAAAKTLTIQGKKGEVTVAVDDEIVERLRDVKVGDKVLVRYGEMDGKNVATKVVVRN